MYKASAFQSSIRTISSLIIPLNDPNFVWFSTVLKNCR